MIKKLSLLLTLIFTVALHANENYTPFINEQISYVYAMNEHNISKEQMETLVENQKRSYLNALEELMKNKRDYLSNVNYYESEIFSLKKIISINKRAGNKYAVLRDEVQLDAYIILANHNKLIYDILLALDHTTIEELGNEITKYVLENEKNNSDILEKDYKYLLEIENNSNIFKKVQENIHELDAIIDINQDIVNHIYLFENKIYRLNKYSKYHLIAPVIYVNNIKTVKYLNSVLEPFNLDVVKILIILVMSTIVYFFRTIIFVMIERNILKVTNLKEYVADILEAIRLPINYILIVVNINLIIYIYYNFSSFESISSFFNILYAAFMTYIVFRVLNVIASSQIHTLDSKDKKIKNEVINIGIKIVNFLILLIGLMVVLHLAGVDLTTVLSGLGIGGFAVAFAAKDSIANFFGTLSIMLSDVYSQGDWIVVDGQEGVVVELGLRVTTLRTFDNALVAIPNAIMANKDVKNWNKRELGRRIKMNLGIRYDSKSEDIKNAVNEIREMLDKHPEIATENTKYDYNYHNTAKLVSRDDSHGIKKTLLVYLDEFSDSSINILVYCFTKSTNWDKWLNTKEDVMHKIMKIFEKNNLEFAFPSLSLYPEKES